jgi:hypothetical protein
MDEGFAAHEEDVADMIAMGNVDGFNGFLEGNTAAQAGFETVDSESAEVALCVADVRDGKLEISGAAMSEDIAEECPG